MSYTDVRTHIPFTIRIGLIVGCLFAMRGGLSGFAEEPVVLEMWSHWGGETMKMRFVEETLQAFEASHPGVTVNLHWINKNRINQSLQASLPKGEGPDVFYAEPYPFQAHPWVLAGYLLDLRDKLEWNRFEPSAYQLVWEYPDRGIYGAPIEICEYAIFYNKAIFADAGVTIPASGRFTEEEFLKLIKLFRAKGMLPMAVGNKDRGTASNALFQGLLLRFAGAEKIRGLMTGKTSWTDPDIVAAFTYMKQLLNAGVFPEELNRLSYQEGRDLFVQGKSAMYAEGTWFFGKVADEQGNLPPGLQGKLGAMDYPTVANGKGNATIERFTGGSYLIRKQSPHIKTAVALLDALTSPDNAVKWVRYTQSPCGMKIGLAEYAAAPFLQELFRSRGVVQDVVVPGTASLLGPEAYKVWGRDLGISFMNGYLSVAEIVERFVNAAQIDHELTTHTP